MVKELIKLAKETKGLNPGCSLYNEMVKQGIISIKYNCWVEMFNYWSVRMIANAEFKDVKARSYTEASEQFNVSEITIRRAVEFMTK